MPPLTNKFTIAALYLALSAGFSASAQVYLTKAASIQFSASTPLEKIEGKNNSATVAYEPSTGKLMANVSIKAFTFESALMQEHFNENYLESDRLPIAKFAGQVDDPFAVNLSKNGIYTANCSGQLSIHGVTKEVKLRGTFSVKDGKVHLSGIFGVKLADYQIKIPGVVRTKIAEEAKVSVNAKLDPVKK